MEKTLPAVEAPLEATVMQRLERLLQLEVMCVMRAADAEWWKLNREREMELRMLREAMHDAARYRWLRGRGYKDGATLAIDVAVIDDVAIGDFGEFIDATADAAITGVRGVGAA